MAKISTVRKNERRRKMVAMYDAKRRHLKSVVRDKTISLGERFATHQLLAALPRNSSKTRIRNRCELTGRGRGYYGKFRVSRLCLRELVARGYLPGVVKASW